MQIKLIDFGFAKFFGQVCTGARVTVTTVLLLLLFRQYCGNQSYSPKANNDNVDPNEGHM